MQLNEQTMAIVVEQITKGLKEVGLIVGVDEAGMAEALARASCSAFRGIATLSADGCGASAGP
jgi:hypothetical protein